MKYIREAFNDGYKCVFESGMVQGILIGAMIGAGLIAAFLFLF